MDTSTTLGLLAVLLLGGGLGGAVGWFAGRWRGLRDAAASGAGTPSGALLAQAGHEAAERALLREGLDRLAEQLHGLERDRTSWQGQLRQHVEDVAAGTEALRRETAALGTALRRPQVRGRWGEQHLRRVVELAGMVERCDFTEQHSIDTPDGVLRPDLVVHLAGGRSVVVDSKVPLDAFLDAASCNDEEERLAHLRRHARQLRTHVDQLAGKAYWRALPGTPEFVVLFLPAEAFLSAALETDPDLLEVAASRQVMLATPTTLVTLLRTVAHAWKQEALTDQVEVVHRLARELHERLGTMGEHLDRVGSSLRRAVESYNGAVGSLESRVLVTARRLGELGVTDDDLPAPRPVTESPRPLSAVELVDRAG